MMFHQRFTLVTYLLSVVVSTGVAFTYTEPASRRPFVSPSTTITSTSSLNVARVPGDSKSDDEIPNPYMQQGSKPTAGGNLIDGEALAAAATAGILGASIAGPLSELDPALTALDQPLLTAAVVGGTTLAATIATADEGTTKAVKRVLATPTQWLGRTIVKQFQNMLSSAKLAITNKITQTKNDILDMPNKFQAYLKQKTDETIANIQNSIDQTKQSILDMPENFVKFLKLKADETAAEIKAMPNKIQVAAIEAIEDTKTKAALAVETAVDDIQTFPKRTGNNIMNYFRQLNGEPTKQLHLTPKPPKMAPPPSKNL